MGRKIRIEAAGLDQDLRAEERRMHDVVGQEIRRTRPGCRWRRLLGQDRAIRSDVAVERENQIEPVDRTRVP